MLATQRNIFPDKSTAQDVLGLFQRVSPGLKFELIQTPQGWLVDVGLEGKKKTASVIEDAHAKCYGPEALVTITLPCVAKTHLTVKVKAGDAVLTINRSTFKSSSFTGTHLDLKLTFTVTYGYAKSKGLVPYIDK